MALYLDTAIQPAKVSIHAAARRCIRSEAFDTTLLVLPLVTGLAAAAAVVANPALFTPLLVANLWLLGYHHVIGTDGRLAFTNGTLPRNHVPRIDLLLVITAAMLALAFTGAWLVASTFFYLQGFCCMQEGYRLARVYFRVTPQGQAAGSRDVAADVDPAAQGLLRINQPGPIAIYVTTCLAISTGVYIALGSFVPVLGGGAALAMAIYMGINFHYYVIDVLLWKRRRAFPQSS